MAIVKMTPAEIEALGIAGGRFSDNLDKQRGTFEQEGWTLIRQDGANQAKTQFYNHYENEQNVKLFIAQDKITNPDGSNDFTPFDFYKET